MGHLLKIMARTGVLSGMDADTIEKLINVDAGWEESKHPRGKGGKFAKKGSGGSGGSGDKDKESKETNVESEHGAAPGTKAAKKSRNIKEKARAVMRGIKKIREAGKAAASQCANKAKQWAGKDPEVASIYSRYAESMSKPQPGRPTPEASKAMTEKFLGNISSKLKPYAVERYKKDLANEPAITKDVCDIAEALGTEMYGLDYRLKKASDSSDGRCRIADKIAEDMNDKKNPLTYEQAVDKLSDQVRYTQACTPENLVENYEKTVSMLEKKGYKMVKTKNTWDSFNINKPYRGINCVFKSPTGTNFELQFHTPDSLVAKEVQHPQYEEQRNPDTSPERFKELGKIMYENQRGLQRPKGVERIKNYP